jgi:membrane protein implicated in regulation of membrane protease activity
MVLLYVYVASLVVGGILLLASLFLGGGHSDALDTDADLDADTDLDIDADADVDVDADVDADADADGHLDADGVGEVWIPFFSMRFWVFFLAFFGLTGTLLQLLEMSGGTMTLIISLAVGLTTGLGAAYTMRWLKKTEVGTLSIEDYRGLEGEVLLPISENDRGKVRIQTKAGQQIDLPARLADGNALERGEKILVIHVKDNEAHVTKLPR